MKRRRMLSTHNPRKSCLRTELKNLRPSLPSWRINTIIKARSTTILRTKRKKLISCITTHAKTCLSSSPKNKLMLNRPRTSMMNWIGRFSQTQPITKNNLRRQSTLRIKRSRIYKDFIEQILRNWRTKEQPITSWKTNNWKILPMLLKQRANDWTRLSTWRREWLRMSTKTSTKKSRESLN